MEVQPRPCGSFPFYQSADEDDRPQAEGYN